MPGNHTFVESSSRNCLPVMSITYSFCFFRFDPFHISIDDDILNLMDEVNLDEFLKEAASAIDNPDILAEYIREKATIAIERFIVRHLYILSVFLMSKQSN